METGHTEEVTRNGGGGASKISASRLKAGLFPY
jgi:hypothetical protein